MRAKWMREEKGREKLTSQSTGENTEKIEEKKNKKKTKWLKKKIHKNRNGFLWILKIPPTLILHLIANDCLGKSCATQEEFEFFLMRQDSKQK